MRWMLFTVAALIDLYGAVVLLLFLGQRAMIYPAPKGPAAIPPGFTRVSLDTADGLALTAAWRAASPGKPTIVFFHGNGDSLPGAAIATQRFAAAGYGVLLADYRGYAGNPGAPDEAGLLADGRAAIAFLQRRGLAPERLVLMGASLGTGVATRMAAERAPATLVLVSPFTSLPDAGAAALPLVPVRMLMHDRFDSLKTIVGVHAPVLILHATDDRVVPFTQGEALAKAAPDARLIRFEGEGHQLQFTALAQQTALDWLEHRPIR